MTNYNHYKATLALLTTFCEGWLETFCQTAIVSSRLREMGKEGHDGGGVRVVIDAAAGACLRCPRGRRDRTQVQAKDVS